ncbi:hypothetical protein, partial [Fusibacter tunisiensis]
SPVYSPFLRGIYVVCGENSTVYYGYFTTDSDISSFRVKNKPIHPPPALSLREQGGLEAGDFSAILVKIPL